MITSVTRRLTYLQLTPASSAFWFKIPSLGIIYIILAYILFILLLQFVDYGVMGPTRWTFVGVRAGWLAIAQIPLIVLLVGKHSLIGGWSRYSGLQSLEWATDDTFRSGVTTYSILFWMSITTITPLRHLSYEFFLIQHIITYFCLIIITAKHIPGSAKYARVYIFVAIALYLVERLVYFFRFTFNNSSSSTVTLEPFEGDVAKMYVSNCRIKSWAPGTHVMIEIPRFGVVQSHPATIMSIPSSHNGDMALFFRAYKEFTRRIYEASRKSLRNTNEDRALINGPYGASHAEFGCFDILVLIAGATGVTLPYVTHRAAAAAEGSRKSLPVRRLILINEELQLAARDLEKAGIVFSIQIFVTKMENSGVTLTNSPVPGPQILDNDAEKVPQQTKYHDFLDLDIKAGRPSWDNLFRDPLFDARGESAVGVCGSLSLSIEVRRKVVPFNRDSNRLVYLHVESFSWRFLSD
ncbi:hypothetical protein N7523_001941 [Penicillium sp. IBT 18751x]|nr:hypothetical protein N7523_001941 [Penicillium sp. IBT 18751x]